MYQYWQHTTSGEVYAVEVRGDKLTGICGPLHYTEHRQVDLLPDYNYQEEDIDWANAEDAAGHWALAKQ